MAKIYLSYNHRDREFVSKFGSALRERGHEIAVDTELLPAGQEWRKILQDALKQADVAIAIITPNSAQSQYVMSELGAARAYAESGGIMLVLPLVLDGADIPPVLRDIQCLLADSGEIGRIVQQVDTAIAAFVGRRAAQEEAQEKVTERIETNSAEFIDDAVRSLSSFESRNRLFGLLWYGVGFTSLMMGLGVAYWSLRATADPKSLTWPELAFISVKCLIAVTLLGAAAKYSFSLGKAFTSESLKASDRLHAISFGRFYLRVFGSKATWPELKEAFQHWNIDRRSAFSDLDAAQIDPKLLEAVVEIAKSSGSKKDDKAD